MNPADNMQREDESRRFLFENADIRGECVYLDRAFQEILAIHQYPPGVAQLMGEFLAAGALLSSTLKFDGKIILQARSEGQIPLLMAECSSKLELRGIARGAQQASSDTFDRLLANGQLAITIDPDQGQRYQGIVPLVQDSLAHSLDAYFRHSEQLGTRLWLAADGKRASGLLLQQLPPQLVTDARERERQWETACTLADTVQDTELMELDATQLLYRLYHEEPVRLFEATPAIFRCSCSRARTRNALASLPAAEILELLEELGTISMDCEFCNQQYRFSRDDLSDILGDDQTRTVH